MALTFEIKAGELPRNIRGRVPRQIFLQEATRAVNEVAIEMRIAAVTAAPFGGTGGAKGWVNVPAREIRPGVVSGGISNPTIQARVLETGARSHRPPTRALQTWVRRVLGLSDPRQVRRAAHFTAEKIRLRGLPRSGQQKELFTRAIRARTGTITGRLRNMRERIIRRLGR